MAWSRDKLQVWMHGKSFAHLTTSIGSNTIALISSLPRSDGRSPHGRATDRMLSLAHVVIASIVHPDDYGRLRLGSISPFGNGSEG